DLAAGPTVPAAARGGGGFATVRAGGEPLRLLTVPVVKGGRFLGALQVASSLAPVERTLGHVGRLFGTGALAALLLSLAAGMFLARRSLAPVGAITRAARTIGAGNLSQRLHLPDHGDELSDLAASFDEMLDRLEAAYQRQREFTANASHELRTPLSLVKAEVSLARRALEELTVGSSQLGNLPPTNCELSTVNCELSNALATIEEETDRMTRLVNDLLLLARLDHGEQLGAEVVGLDEV